MCMFQVDSFHAPPARAFGPSPRHELCPKADLQIIYPSISEWLCNGASCISARLNLRPVEKTDAHVSQETHVDEVLTSMVDAALY